MKICSIEGCGKKHRGLGYCDMHYQRFRANGQTGLGRCARLPLVDRLWRRVDKSGDCWIWTGAVSKSGYGVIQEAGLGSRNLTPHRLSYELHKGAIPAGYVVMHSCDNRLCVNPDHLSVGTPQENIWDMVRKGRNPVLVDKIVLTPEIVRRIRNNPKIRNIDFARELGVHPSTIRSVRIGRTWSHIK